MLPALVTKSWRDDRRAIIGWIIGIGAFTTIYTSFYKAFRDAAEIKQQAMPQGMLDFLGVADMTSPAGYLQATVFALMGPLLLIMAAITLSARTIAQPEEDGGIELLLTNPLSRTRFALQRLASTGAALTLIAAVPGILLLIIVPAVGMTMSLSNLTAASAGLVALVWCFAGIAFLIGAATGRRGTVLAGAGVVATAGYVANAFGGMFNDLRWLRWLSPFHYATGTDPLHTGWHPIQLLVLVAVAAATMTAGVLLFDRRDIGV